MSSNSNSGKKSKKKTAFSEAIDVVDDDEVNQLLRAAQDDLLLKLSLNSHIAKATPSYSSQSHLDPDLDSRFEALKSKSKSNLYGSTGRITSEVKTPEKDMGKAIESDDLFARFAALKGSSSSVPSSHSNEVMRHQQSILNEKEEGDDDEVEKLIKWAIDAARLDPSPPSDSDNDEGRDDDDDDDDEGDDDHTDDDRGEKNKRK